MQSDATNVISRATVRIRNAVFFAYHGAWEVEQQDGGRFEVDVDMDLCIDGAAESDSLEDTADYNDVFLLVKRLVTTRRFHLIETLTVRIAQGIMEQCDRVQRVTVTVRKPNPPIDGTVGAVEVVYQVTRPSGPNIAP